LKGRIPRGAPTKEVSRVILDTYSSGYERDSYALGSSKVFLRENLEAVLEKTRQDIQEVGPVILSDFFEASFR
jgi:myosin heavy subunit